MTTQPQNLEQHWNKYGVMEDTLQSSGFKSNSLDQNDGDIL